MTAFVLVGTTLPENLGAAARVLANFGFSDLRLVAPEADPAHPRALATAASGEAVLRGARRYDTLAEALADRVEAWATTALPRELRSRVCGPRALADVMALAPGRADGLALVFGPERTGLGTEDVARCHGVVAIPTDPACRALNLAQAVGILAWELREASLRSPAEGTYRDTFPPAPMAAQERFFAALEARITERGLWPTPGRREHTLRNLRQTLLRAGFTASELHTLRGVVEALARPAPAPEGSGGAEPT